MSLYLVRPLNIGECIPIWLSIYYRQDIPIITSDLLFENDENPLTQCVSNLFASQAFLARLQNYVFYFTPYLKANHSTFSFYKKILKQYKIQLLSAHWADQSMNTY